MSGGIATGNKLVKMKKEIDKWKTIHLEDWDEFDEHVESMEHRQWIFRGQTDASWELKSSLYRLFEDIQPIIKQHKGYGRKFAKDKHEQLLIEQFQANAHLYLNTLPAKTDKIEWLAIMQHFGAPTRLLDVSFSPHIATYFALESGHKDCCIYAFDHSKFKLVDDYSLPFKNYKDKIFEGHKGEKSFFIPYEPKTTNERLVAQQGLFLVPSTNYETIDEILGLYGIGENACIKLVIPGHMRFEGIRRLKRMNITSATLFPGIDGFCRSLRYQILDTTKNLKRLPH